LYHFGAAAYGIKTIKFEIIRIPVIIKKLQKKDNKEPYKTLLLQL